VTSCQPSKRHVCAKRTDTGARARPRRCVIAIRDQGGGHTHAPTHAVRGDRKKPRRASLHAPDCAQYPSRHTRTAHPPHCAHAAATVRSALVARRTSSARIMRPIGCSTQTPHHHSRVARLSHSAHHRRHDHSLPRSRTAANAMSPHQQPRVARAHAEAVGQHGDWPSCLCDGARLAACDRVFLRAP